MARFGDIPVDHMGVSRTLVRTGIGVLVIVERNGMQLGTFFLGHVSESGVVRDTLCASLDVFPQERELEMVLHYIRRTLDIALLHEKLKMAHDLVFKLLEPFVQFHMVLIGLLVIILSSSGLSPVRFGLLQGAIDIVVEQTVPLCRGTVETDSEDTRLDA